MAISFPGIDAAIDYLSGKLQDFYDRRFELSNRYQEARNLFQEAHRQGVMIPEAEENFRQAMTLVQEHQELTDRLKPLASAFSVTTGLGIAPVVITAIQLAGGTIAVLSLATAVYNWFDSNQIQKENQKLVRDGLAPPDILAPEPGFLGNFADLLSSTTGLILVGILGLVAYKTIK